jgi:ferredoxin
MKVKADSTRCQGHALCAAVSESLFPLDEEGYSALTSWTDVPAGAEKNARVGQASCPERAIEIEE